MKTKISKRFFRELAILAKSDPSLVKSLAQELPKITPQLYPFDSFLEVVRGIVGQFQPPQNDRPLESRVDFAADLSQSLTSLLYTAGASSLSNGEAISSAIATIEANFSDHLEILTEFVQSVLGCRNLLLSFKSTALREDNENIVVDSKIIVDIRPIFDFDISSEINAHTFLYRLKITHRTSSDVESKVYTLSQDALDELSHAVDRAKEKIEQLKSLPLSGTLGVLLEENK